MSWFSRYRLADIMLALHNTNLKLDRLGAKMSTVQDAVDQIVDQLAKAQAEIVDKIADLETAIAAGEVPDLTALKAAAQALDDVVVDVVEPPADEPVA